jgi:protein SCO1/2
MGAAERSPGPLSGEQRFALAGLFAWLGISAAWWALAFAPLPAPDSWLAAARAVCFGSLPNGLPERWGWMLLWLAPAAVLSFLLAVWGRPLVEALARVARRGGGRILLSGLALATGAGAWAVADRVAAAARVEAALAPAVEPLPEAYPRTADPAPPLRLVDARGEPFDLALLRGRPVFLTFAYGHCVTVCPLLVDALRSARASYPGSAPPAVVVTLDPWRDTPRALPGLARAWKLDAAAGETLLSGPADEVRAAAEAYEVGFSRDERTGEITHAGITFVLDAEGRIAYRFLGPPAHWLVEAARRLEREARTAAPATAGGAAG